jgi:hypothetical protein
VFFLLSPSFFPLRLSIPLFFHFPPYDTASPNSK